MRTVSRQIDMCFSHCGNEHSLCEKYGNEDCKTDRIYTSNVMALRSELAELRKWFFNRHGTLQDHLTKLTNGRLGTWSEPFNNAVNRLVRKATNWWYYEER